jgi:hypothetical protein
MSVVIAAEPIAAGTAAHQQDHRPRHTPGQAPILHDAALPARQAAMSNADQKNRQRDSRQKEPPPKPELPPGAMFAAAVLAGALPPKPETRAELLLRIGGSHMPQDTEMYLRNRLA